MGDDQALRLTFGGRCDMPASGGRRIFSAGMAVEVTSQAPQSTLKMANSPTFPGCSFSLCTLVFFSWPFSSHFFTIFSSSTLLLFLSRPGFAVAVTIQVTLPLQYQPGQGLLVVCKRSLDLRAKMARAAIAKQQPIAT